MESRSNGKASIGIGIYPLPLSQEISIVITARKDFMVYYVVGKMFGCQHDPKPSNIEYDADGGDCYYTLYDAINYSVQFSMIDTLNRLKNAFPNSDNLIFEGGDCFVEKYDDENPENGLQFSFQLTDFRLEREEAAFRLKHKKEINDQNISDFFKIPDGPVVCSEDSYHTLVNKKAAEIFHPDGEFAQRRARRFEHAQEIQKRQKFRSSVASASHGGGEDVD